MVGGWRQGGLEDGRYPFLQGFGIPWGPCGHQRFVGKKPWLKVFPRTVTVEVRFSSVCGVLMELRRDVQPRFQAGGVLVWCCLLLCFPC